jgi:hypothetical protein
MNRSTREEKDMMNDYSIRDLSLHGNGQHITKRDDLQQQEE